jgi:hypothetical protein
MEDLTGRTEEDKQSTNRDYFTIVTYKHDGTKVRHHVR